MMFIVFYKIYVRYIFIYVLNKFLTMDAFNEATMPRSAEIIQQQSKSYRKYRLSIWGKFFF